MTKAPQQADESGEAMLISKIKTDFTQIPNRFMRESRRLSNSAFRLFVVLKWHADKKGVAFPSYDTLTQETGLSRATIAAAARDLALSGWLTTEKRFGKSVVYILRYPPASSSKSELLARAAVVPNSNSSSSKTELLEESTVVQKLNSSSLKTEPSVVQKLDSNNNQLTKPNNNKDKKFSPAVVAVGGFSDSERAILSAMQTFGLTLNRRTGALIKRIAATLCHDPVAEVNRICEMVQKGGGRAGVMIQNLDAFDWEKPPAVTVPTVATPTRQLLRWDTLPNGDMQAVYKEITSG